MKTSSYEQPIASDSKYPWGDRFNRLKATEEMRRFAEYILHQLQFDTINTDSDSILSIFNDYLKTKQDYILANYIRKIDSSIQLENTDAIAEFLFRQFSEKCLEMEHFYWIQIANQRVCNFVFAITNNWSYFFDKNSDLYKKTIPNFSQPGLTDFSNGAFDNSITLNHMRFTNSAPRAKVPRQKKERIIEFFDRLDDEIAKKAKQLQFIELLWNKIVKSQKPKSWWDFKKLDNEDLLWIKDQIDQDDLFFKIIDGNSNKDIFEAITTYFDLLFVFKESDCIVKVDKIKKSLTQKKYRKNNPDSKQYNFIMGVDIERKLKEITKAKGLKRNVVIEKLINDAYCSINFNK
ncbi:hypothetical protein [Aeromonas rivipollensis]|uniref:hypothetical protein n=1 Tax=Aeromonas rivipollensis TaxID=948519 RepID=UPI001F1822CA|nr:hypothetical protein [Aeromonas rivipollensis]MCE9943359.1 hypothetical protein [Aeromonas rivipollensis]